MNTLKTLKTNRLREKSEKSENMCKFSFNEVNRKVIALNKVLTNPVKKINANKIIRCNLIKHNSNKNKFEFKIINDIVYDEKKHIVAKFKENLIWEDYEEYFIK
jgi:hypothetical protein